MTEAEIKQLHNFSINEKDIFGRPIFEKVSEIKTELMERIDKTITIAKQYYGDDAKFIVHDINRGKHSEKSYHYEGIAIDGHFKDLEPIIGFILLVKAGFKGIGYYPDWVHPGWHADLRKQDHISTWVALNVYGEQRYFYEIVDFVNALNDRNRIL